VHGEERLFPIGWRSIIDIEKSGNCLATRTLKTGSGIHPHSEPKREGFRHISLPHSEEEYDLLLAGKNF